MRLPIFRGVKGERVFRIGAFGGYNNTPGCKEGEFSQMKNLSSKNHPAMSPISDWAVFGDGMDDVFLYENNIFKITQEGDFYKNFTLIRENIGLKTREFSVIGNKLIIMPDKLYYDMDSGELGSLEAAWGGKGSFKANSLSLRDTLVTEHDLTPLFRSGDCVKIVIDGQDRGYYCISDIKSGEIVFENADFADITNEATIGLAREIPLLENTFECNNRLWGTSGDVIYASALGDPFNFYKYRGISTDSYFKEIYSAGEFTSGIAYGETPLFFKEKAIYRVYGNTPEDFVVDVKEAPGVSFDCRYSAVNLGGAVYYAASDGIYVYSSAYPTKISEALGDLRIGNANGGTDGKKYYVSFSEFHGIKADMSQMLQAYHNNRFYSFDAEKGCWYKYDEDLRIKKTVTGVYGSIFKKPNTFALDNEGRLLGISDKFAGTTATFAPETNLRLLETESWGVSGVIDFGGASRISCIRLMLKAFENTEFHGEISFDGGDFEPFCSVNGGDGRERKYTFPIKRKRFSYCRLRFGGVGDYVLSAVEVYYSLSANHEK